MSFSLKFIFTATIALALIMPGAFVLSSTSDGTVTGYAWGENTGYINFGLLGGNIHVTNSALTGYAWNDIFGWINLSPISSGVLNNGSGTLSGYAWGEKLGWINFSGVLINCSGQFKGTATGEKSGTINFECLNCNVLTDWRAESCNTGGGGGGGGGSSEVTHTECNNYQCVTVSGIGNNQCQTNANCAATHNECASSQCVVVDGLGVNQCQNNSECITPKHNECNAQKQCVAVDGTGSDTCLVNADCNITHKECANQKCVNVDGTGSNQCQDDASCITPKHNECNTQKQCVIIDGVGQDLCQNNEDCKLDHRECSSLKCILVDGLGADQCQNDSNCEQITPPPPVPPVGGTQIKHNECNTQMQCVAVDGIGEDKCNNNFDCKEKEIVKPIIKEVTLPVQEIFQKTVENLPEQVKIVTKEFQKIIETPQGSAITKTVSTVGVVTATAVTTTTTFFSSFSFFELLTTPLRLLGLLLIIFGIKKRATPWGVVYDSVTKQPIDPAIVSLRNMEGKEVSSAVTDLDGRYGFLIEPGEYQIFVKKANYVFPSVKLVGKELDEIYSNLYFGGAIKIEKQGEVITKNIPLDQVGFNWNEFAKKDKKLLKFYSTWDYVLRKAADIFYIVGFAVAVIAFIFAPYPYNTIILALYIFLLVLRVLGVKPKKVGYILDKKTGEPLSFAIIRVIVPKLNVEVAHKVADKYGKYFCLIPRGEYFIKIEKKNLDGSYSLVYTSETIKTSSKGIIRKRFKI